MLAAAGILVYAAATAGTAALIKPIFGEVLLAGDEHARPARRPHLGSGGRGRSRPEPALVGDLKKRLNLARQIDSSYESLKRRLGVDRDNVVYFVPAPLRAWSSCCAASPTSSPATPSSTSAWG